jgi:PAS domain S-box-containing protein
LRTGEARGLANHTILLSRDGTERPIDDSAAPIRQADGTLAGVVLVFRDVSEQERAREAAVRLAAIVEFSGDAILTKSTEGIIRTWNTGAQQLFGYSSEEIVGKSVSILFPQEKLTEEDHILERLRKGQPSEALETVRIAKNGTRIPVLASVSPLKDSEGNVIGASTIIHDLTELVRAREALAREQELLATTLASIGTG